MANVQSVASCVHVSQVPQGNWEKNSSIKHFEINDESILSSRFGLFSSNFYFRLDANILGFFLA